MATDNMKNKKKINKIKVIIFAALGFVVTLVVAVVVLVWSLLDRMNYVPLDEDYTILEETKEHEEDEFDEEDVTNSSQDEINDYQSAVENAIANQDIELPDLGDIYNIMLIGTDERKIGGSSRSDSMILVSINKKSKQIVFTSFMRDSYVKIPNKGFYKLNAAYAYGGVELLFDTMEYNFSIYPEKYIQVNFMSFVKVVDILGGVEVSVEENELYWVNQYIGANNKILGEPIGSGLLTFANGSPQVLSGKQALAYSRVRYVGNADFTRTQRQRTVMDSIFKKMQKTDPATLIELFYKIFPEVTTNIPKDEFLELICLIPELSEYDMVSHSVPNHDVGAFKFLGINGDSFLALELDVYIPYIYNTIYPRSTSDK